MLSFVVPAYNEEREIAATLLAIRDAADTSKHAYEIVVVDDASTDRTAAIAADLGAGVVRVDRRQIAAARNAGAEAAAGEILFFVDADTRIDPAHVQGALASLENGDVGGSARVDADGTIPRWARVSLAIFSLLYFGSNLGVGAFLFTRRETFREVGGFDEELFAGEEVYFSLALKKLGRFRILDVPVITSGRKLRMHPASFVFAQSFYILCRGKRGLRRREKLQLWYDGKRESNPI
jgi:glycosyltransferase involved in cell wall biosynthesis